MHSSTAKGCVCAQMKMKSSDAQWQRGRRAVQYGIASFQTCPFFGWQVWCHFHSRVAEPSVKKSTADVEHVASATIVPGTSWSHSLGI